MERNIQKNGLVNLMVLLAAGLAGFAVARHTHSLAGQVCALYLGIGIFVAAASWFQMRLEQSERLEKLEVDEMAKGRAESALFEGKDAELFPARRAREQFERFFVPVFTVLLCLAQGGGAYWLWRWISNPTTSRQLKDPVAGILFALCFLVLFVLGRFAASFSRLEGQRLLRPGASYLLLNAFICIATAGGIAAVWVGYPDADYIVALVLCGLLALIALETLVTLVLEIYRPRVKGKVERPLYESRLVGLLGQPEGLVTTAAQAIDYQFGFKVSETWFYRFFIQAILWLVPLQLLVLLLSTSVVIIEPGEQGILERFGRTVPGRTVLEPGPHLVWPRPIDKVYRVQTERIQSLEVGTKSEHGEAEESTVLWSKAHPEDENFLVANRERATQEPGDAATAKRTPPVSLLTVGVPVLYQIASVTNWVYQNEGAEDLLNALATREVVRYLAGVDMNEIMSSGRLEASAALARHIQAAADERQLGVRIISVGLQDLHPPVTVAGDYEKVVGSTYTRQAKILAAQADEIRTNALARAQAASVVNKAGADRIAREVSALAQAALFTNQVPAFQAAPSVYAQRAYLQTFARATANARKYVLLTTNTHDVLTFDLQESVARDILNLNVPAPKSK